MPGTGHEVKQLRHAVQEIDYLGYEEQQRGLAEVANYADHSKRHSRKITKRVPHENPRWIPAKHTIPYPSNFSSINIPKLYYEPCEYFPLL